MAFENLRGRKHKFSKVSEPSEQQTKNIYQGIKDQDGQTVLDLQEIWKA